MGTFTEKWDSFKDSLHGAAHTTKARVCKTVDTAKQKNLISREQHKLEALYAEIGGVLCAAIREGKLILPQEEPVRMTADLARRLGAFSTLEQEMLCKIAEMELALKEIRSRDVRSQAEEPADPEEKPADPADAPADEPADPATEAAALAAAPNDPAEPISEEIPTEPQIS